ncbi:hypothetical protein [Nonomuraea sp. NPDC002799]
MTGRPPGAPEPARPGAHDLDHVRDLARVLVRDLDRVRDLDSRLAWNLDYIRSVGDRARSRTGDYQLACDIDDAINLARDLAGDLADDDHLDHTYNLARDLARDLDFICASVHSYYWLKDNFRAALSAAFTVSNTIAEDLRHRWTLRETAVEQPHRRPRMTVSRVGERLLSMELRLLPAGHRSRFSDEFRAELQALAEANASESLQVMYSFQQIRRVWQLRAALRAPHRPRLHRLHRLACWMLASDRRTWGTLGPLMAFAAVNVQVKQGWGSAFFTIPSVVAFYAGVEWLREHWNVEVERRGRSPKNSA